MAGFMTEFRYRVHILTLSKIWTLPWLIILRLRLPGRLSKWGSYGVKCML